MRDHKKILGTFFLAWGVVQLVGALLIAFGVGPQVELPVPWLYYLTSVLMAFAYGFTGLRLRVHDPRVRLASLLLAGLALLSFPIGTALGAYGLWALLRKPKEVPSS